MWGEDMNVQFKVQVQRCHALSMILVFGLNLALDAPVYGDSKTVRKHFTTTFYPTPYAKYGRVRTYGLKMIGGIYNTESSTVSSLAQINKVNLHKGFVVGDIIPTDDNVYTVLDTVLSASNDSLSLLSNKMMFSRSSGIYAHNQRVGLLTDTTGSDAGMQLRSTGSVFLQPLFSQSPGHYKHWDKSSPTGDVYVQGNLKFRTKMPINFEHKKRNSHVSPQMIVKNINSAGFDEAIVLSVNKDEQGLLIVKNDNNEVTLKVDPANDKVTMRGNIYVKKRVKINGQNIVPAGTIMMFCGTSVPSGWAVCNGQVLSNGYVTPNLVGRFLRGRPLPQVSDFGGGAPHSHFHTPNAISNPDVTHKHPAGSFGLIDLKTTSVWGARTVTNIYDGGRKVSGSIGWPNTRLVSGAYKAYQVESFQTESGYSSNYDGYTPYYCFLKVGPHAPSGIAVGSMDHYHHLGNRTVQVDIPESPLRTLPRVVTFNGATSGSNYWNLPRADVVFIVKLASV